MFPRMFRAQGTIACLVPLRPHEAQTFTETLQRIEILQAVDVFKPWMSSGRGCLQGVDVFRAYLAASCRHDSHYDNFELKAQRSQPSLEHYRDGCILPVAAPGNAFIPDERGDVATGPWRCSDPERPGRWPRASSPLTPPSVTSSDTGGAARCAAKRVE